MNGVVAGAVNRENKYAPWEYFTAVMYRARIFCGKINIEYQEDSQEMKKTGGKKYCIPNLSKKLQ